MRCSAYEGSSRGSSAIALLFGCRRLAAVAELSLDVMNAKRFPWWTASAVVTAIFGNVVAALIPVGTLLQMAPGSSGRLMGEAFLTFIVAAITLISVVGLAIIGFRLERHPVVIAIALCFSLTPFFFSGSVMRSVAGIRQISLKP